MLTETVIRQQEFVFGNICHHRIRPMQHRRCQKAQIALADINRIAGLDNLILPPGCVKMRFQSHLSGRIGDNDRLRRQFHNLRNTARMILLHMVDNHIINFTEIDNRPNSCQLFLRHIGFNPVNQRDFVVHNQIAVVG